MRRKIILERLEQITDEDWIIILAKARTHVNIRIHGRTRFGAHSEQNLGMNAEEFYVGESIHRIFEGIRDWKFEERSLIDEIIRIIDSLISEEVRKYTEKKEKNRQNPILYEPDSFVFEEIEEEVDDLESIYSKQIELIIEAIDGDEILEKVYFEIHEGLTYNEIVTKLNITKRQLYKSIEKIKNKGKTLLSKKKN